MKMNKIHRLGIYEKAMPSTLPIKEKLRTSKEFGYDFMEISIDESPEKLARLDMTVSDRTEIIKIMRDVDFPIHTMCLSGHRKYPLGSSDASVRDKSMEIMKKAIQFACDMGIRIIQIAGYDVYYEDSTAQTRAYFEENLYRSVEFAAQYGVTLAFETMETPFMNSIKKAMVYVRDINSPYLQVYPDCGNLVNAALTYGEDFVQDIRSGKGHIAAMHLKETVPGKFREIKYGTGHVDFERIIIQALQQGVRMFVTEFWDVPTVDYREQILFSKRFIDDKFTSAYSILESTLNVREYTA